LVTGANGMVGSALCDALALDGIELIKAVRTATAPDHHGIGVINGSSNWSKTLEGVTTIVHTAARVHVMQDSTHDPLAEYRKVNVEGSLNLARQAISAKVKRFIFISTIKVNGDSTAPGKYFTAEDKSDPKDPYGISKRETEIGLRQLGEESGMDIVIIRPPLVYGPGVKANFLSMMRWIDWGVLLPFGTIQNKRSLVGLDNLVDLIMTCIEHPGAANQTFLAGDGEDLSTTELLHRMGNALGKPARLIPFPVGLLTLIARLLGKKDVIQRLCSSLQVDISKAQELLGWVPPVSVEEGLLKTAQDYKNRLSSKLHKA